MPPHADADHPSLNIKTLPLAYDPANSEDSARKLLITLNPEWICSPGPIEFERFKDGITNTVCSGLDHPNSRLLSSTVLTDLMVSC